LNFSFQDLVFVFEDLVFVFEDLVFVFEDLVFVFEDLEIFCDQDYVFPALKCFYSNLDFCFLAFFLSFFHDFDFCFELFSPSLDFFYPH